MLNKITEFTSNIDSVSFYIENLQKEFQKN